MALQEVHLNAAKPDSCCSFGTADGCSFAKIHAVAALIKQQVG